MTWISETLSRHDQARQDVSLHGGTDAIILFFSHANLVFLIGLAARISKGSVNLVYHQDKNSAPRMYSIDGERKGRRFVFMFPLRDLSPRTTTVWQHHGGIRNRS